jgi:hypothetical protein
MRVFVRVPVGGAKVGLRAGRAGGAAATFDGAMIEGTTRFNDPLGTEWVAALLLLVLVLLAYTNVASPKKWRLLRGAFLTLRLGRQVMREDLDLQDRTLIGLLVGALLVVALFAYQSLVLLGVVPTGIEGFLRVLGISVGVLVGQVLLLRSLGVLFQGDGGLQEYIYTVVLITVLLGLLLLPVVVLVAYQPAWRLPLLMGGSVLLALLVLYRWVRALVIGVGEGVPPRHVFLYLCAAELLPVALAYHAAAR